MILLLVQIERHHMVLFKVLNLSLLIDHLALFILKRLFGNDPIVV